MRRSGSYEPDPENEDEGFLARLRARLSDALSARGRGRPQQALPLSRAGEQIGPVVPYHERRQQLLRARRQATFPALPFIIVLLVLLVGIIYGLAWALGGLTQGSGARATPTVPAPATVPAAVPSPSPSVAVLPPAGPGATAPTPSPSPAPTAVPGPGTPAPGATRTYVIKAGDTLNQIARDFGVSVDALMRANNISDPRALRIGDTLTVPPTSTPAPR